MLCFVLNKTCFLNGCVGGLSTCPGVQPGLPAHDCPGRGELRCSVSSFLRVQCLGSPLLSCIQLFKQDSLGGYIMQQTRAVLNSVGPSGTWCLACLRRCCDHGIPRPSLFLEVWYYLHLPWQKGGRELHFSDSLDVSPCFQDLSRQLLFAA